jgi:regulatory protein
VSPRRTRPPLTREKLDELALAYVARFATSRKKVADYLHRKVRERGWDGEGEAPVMAIVERLVDLRYVDDAAFAQSKARSMRQRGYGNRRVGVALQAAGIDEESRGDALDCGALDEAEAALRFARRRRIGPYAAENGDRAQQEKWLAAMLRAGHGLDLSRRIILWAGDNEPEPERLID